ncbi:probable 39S ribosomal protein L49, mitochondrial [Bradysia coprophila]|uniref:probable 39S ribosomal protein L49, mitochondrial n=1 Tax=Bradysia coprophila TaxID=38358 RepID=UPI00187DD083|nr:probable 39S ribosomal protein L49, mitochondrial [Bradysia coprophila]
MASGSLRRFSTIFGKTFNVTATAHGKYLVSNIPQSLVPCSIAITPPIRYSSFQSSHPVEPIDQYPEVEVLTNPPEWKYVERILRKPLVPEPEPKPEYPSGWKPQTEWSHPYFVRRTKNHMIPVYLEKFFRGQRHITKLQKIQGDIWMLERELSACIEARVGKKIATRVNELSGQIWMKGDYVTIVRDFVMKKGL